MEYLKQLWNKVLAKNTTLLESTETLQVVEAKQKEVTNISLENKMEQQLSKKKSNQGNTMGILQSRWEEITPVRGVCMPCKIV